MAAASIAEVERMTGLVRFARMAILQKHHFAVPTRWRVVKKTADIAMIHISDSRTGQAIAKVTIESPNFSRL